MLVKIFPINLKQVISKLDLTGAAIPGIAKKTTKALAEQILKDSNELPPRVPVDTTALQSTGRVEQVRSESGRFGSGYAVIYGGQADNGIFVDYANQVHDDLRSRKYQRPGSGPKFVEVHFLRRTDRADLDYEAEILALTRSLFG